MDCSRSRSCHSSRLLVLETDSSKWIAWRASRTPRHTDEQIFNDMLLPVTLESVPEFRRNTKKREGSRGKVTRLARPYIRRIIFEDFPAETDPPMNYVRITITTKMAEFDKRHQSP